MRPLIALFCLLFLGTASAQPPGVDETAAAAWQASTSHETAGRYREALADLDELSQADRTDYVYLLRKGWLLYLSGEHRESIAAYEAAVVKEPKAVEPRLGLLLPQMALRLWVDAEATAREAQELDPGSYLAGSRLAWILFNLGRYPDAEAAYTDVLAHYPSDVEMKAGLAWSLLKQGNKAEAEKLFIEVLTRAPQYEIAVTGLTTARK